MDCWSTLAAMAAVTTRLRLGVLVNSVLYRTAWATARHAADVDRISGGRLVLGLGAGWLQFEFEQLGIAFPELSSRRSELDRTIREVKSRWGEGSAAFSGTAAAAATPSPLGWPPVQKPRVPLLIGGAGDATLRRVAEFADMCNIEADHNPSPDDVRQRFITLCRHCDSIGRPYTSIARSHFENRVILAPTQARAQHKLDSLRGGLPPTYQHTVGRTPTQLVEDYGQLVRSGVQYFIVFLLSYDDLETMELLACSVLPQLQESFETTRGG
jgi:alkanesulfonate monooxygenase SsuD/methylene tetrahydromethanopterin reductase-like flavin-dependent oxidoreductase (luciferase family)